MGTLSNAWNISSSALSADQAALNTVANNTANASLPGYTEESTNWQEAATIPSYRGAIGEGVIDAGAVSQRDRVLNMLLDTQTQQQAASAARLSALQNLESLFPTGASGNGGIAAGLSGFFSSLQQLEANPSDPSLRQAVLAAANTLSTGFNSASASLQQQQVSLNSSVVSVVTEANGYLQSIAALNRQIQSTSPNQDAGPLEDQRQQDLASLSALIGIQQTTTERNGLDLSTLGGQSLLNGNVAPTLTTGLVNGTVHVFQGSTDITASIQNGGGQAGGLLEVDQQDIPAAQSSLDTLAYGVASEVNTVNENGIDLNGNAGVAIFSLPATASGSARTISVAITDPSLIAAAKVGAGPSDSTNLAAMAALANTATVGGYTPSGYFSNFISALGSTVASVATANTAQQASVAQLTSQQTAISGVSLDSEATSLENIQSAYQAASKVFTIVDQLVLAAINLGVEVAAT